MLSEPHNKPKARKGHTYISLFSSAGVGCFGFKEAGFDCIATNELIPRRLAVQRHNRKCRFESGYICGDITTAETKEAVFREIERRRKGSSAADVDVVIATPPCQGMSVANHKKTDTEIVRNSLVVESIRMVLAIRPKFFVFENVPAFIKTPCTDTDGEEKTIGEAIRRNLGKDYSYTWKVINFKDYGACSSRSRTLVIGVRRDIADVISPFELFPDRQEEKTLREVIGHLPPLTEMGQGSPNDIYHSFRPYPAHMRAWIHDLKEGECSFDQADPLKRPHQIKDGVSIENTRKNGDKYRRQCWDKVGPCVHTRNDQLASQNTIHPQDDRVFSIRELMLMMTVPTSFRWVEEDPAVLSALPVAEKQKFLKKEEIKIRQSLGEAVPTAIFGAIAVKIREILNCNGNTNKSINALAAQKKTLSHAELVSYLRENPDGLSLSALTRMAELTNTRRTETGAYYTNKSIITEILHRLPEETDDVLHILEPAVGVGSFLPLIAKRFDTKEIHLDVTDIDGASLEVLQALLPHMQLPARVHVNIIHADFLTRDFGRKYHYIIGNPPFGKCPAAKLREYTRAAVNQKTKNIFSFFLEKCVHLGERVALILPKSVINAPEFAPTRDLLEKNRIHAVLDFGEHGFKGVLVETVALLLEPAKRPSSTMVYSMLTQEERLMPQSYLTDKAYPYWLLYRDAFFDKVAASLEFNCFSVFRDRQLTTAMLQQSGSIRVLKSRNIDDKGAHLTDIPGYDAFTDDETARKLHVYRYLREENVYMTPNMTYKPRVMKKPQGVLVNGSVALLIPKTLMPITEEMLAYFAGEEFRRFYQIARNRQSRSLNVDACSVFFFGLKRDEDVSFPHLPL